MFAFLLGYGIIITKQHVRLLTVWAYVKTDIFKTRHCSNHSERLFEYHVISYPSKPRMMLMMLWYMFENPVISSASQTVGPIRRGIFEFECHVILSSAKPRLPQVDCCSSFEYHVILSSAKPSKRGGLGINFCSLWAQVYLLLRPSVCDSSF